MSATKWTTKARIALAAKRVPILKGPPGVGKTDMVVNEIHRARHGDAPCVVTSPSLHDPTDANGPLAVIVDKAVRLLPEALKPLFEAGRGTWFIDELTTAPQSTQGAFLRPVQNREVGEHRLPDGVDIIIAMNPADIAAGGSDMVVPLANRGVHIDVGAPTGVEWSAFIARTLVEDEIARNVATLFGKFVETREGLLLALPDDEDKRSSAWPSPRSWHSAAVCYAQALRENEPAAGHELIAGCIGEGAAKEIITYLKNVDLPAASDVLTGKATWAPERHRVDKTDVMLLNLAKEAASEDNRYGTIQSTERQQVIERAWDYFRLACEAGQADVAYKNQTPLRTWRQLRSGAARASGPIETAVKSQFFNVAKAEFGA